MPRKKKVVDSGFAIAVLHPDGVVGYLAAPDTTVEAFSTEQEASRAMESKRKDTRYTWSLPMEVRKYP